MRCTRDSPLIQLMMPVGCIFATPAVLMQLNNEIVVPCGFQDMLTYNVNTGRLVRGRKQNRGLGRIKTKPLENALACRIAGPKQRVKLGQSDFMHRRATCGTGLTDFFHAIVPFDKDLVTRLGMGAEIAIENIFDARAMVDKTQERFAIALRGTDGVSHDNHIESSGVVGHRETLSPKTRLQLPSQGAVKQAQPAFRIIGAGEGNVVTGVLTEDPIQGFKGAFSG